jgi:hypothetical protein
MIAMAQNEWAPTGCPCRTHRNSVEVRTRAIGAELLHLLALANSMTEN